MKSRNIKPNNHKLSNQSKQTPGLLPSVFWTLRWHICNNSSHAAINV
jgi:hypothetical protein